MIPIGDRQLIQLWWTDSTNVAGGWFDVDELDQWSVDGSWECSNTGWLVYEDEICYVLAGRMTCDGKNAGLVERIPKTAVTHKLVIPTTSGREKNTPSSESLREENRVQAHQVI